MKDEYVPLLHETLKHYRKKEGFEPALARVVKKKGLTYETYIEIITELREYAYEIDRDVGEVAKDLIKAVEAETGKEKENY